MVKKLNPSFVEYFAAYLKKLLTDKKNGGTISAKLFQDAVTNAANVYLNENYGADPSAARAAIAQSAPEAECAKAIKAREFHGIGPDPRISDYKTQAGIDTATNLATLEDAMNNYSAGNAYNTRALTVKWISKTNMLLPDATGRKRQQAVEFTPGDAAYCGKCWICMTDVMSYSGFSNQWYDGNDNQVEAGTQYAQRLGCKTPCGDCEHVSAIMASYIAGMLTSGGFAEFYWASYYVACVECNRRKSNYIGVKLSATKGWEVDDNGVNAIVDAIFPMNGVDHHASEYNPIRNALSEKYNGMTPEQKRIFRDEVKVYIEAGTKTWCLAANKKMGNMTEKTKHIKMSFNVSKIIVAITGHLNVITGPLQKRANKAVKAGRTPVKPKLGKKRGGGPVGSDSDSDDVDMEDIGAEESDDEATQIVTNEDNAMVGIVENTDDTQRTDTEDTQIVANEDTQSKQVDTEKTEGEMVDDHMNVEIEVKDTPSLQWYNLIGEAEVDAEYDDEDDKEDDRETDDEFNARILKYCDVIVEYIGNTYSRLLFKQYESDPTTFEELMVNLSESMYETLESTNKDLPKLTDETLDLLIAKFAETGLKVAGVKLMRLVSNKPEQTEMLPKPPSTPSPTPKEKEVAVVTVQRAIKRPVNFPFVNEKDTQDDDDAEVGRYTDEAENVKHDGDMPSKKAKTDSRPASGRESVTIPYTPGGSRLNKHHSKNKSPTHNQKNRTKRVSYIKHKQTRKNHHSRKTK